MSRSDDVKQRVVDFIARREAALDRVRRMLVDKLHVQREPRDIDPDVAIFGTGLGLDSVDAVELVLCLETDFGVRIADRELSQGALRTVAGIVDRVLAAETSDGGAR